MDGFNSTTANLASSDEHVSPVVNPPRQKHRERLLKETPYSVREQPATKTTTR